MAKDGEFLDGEKHGVWVTYYANGQKMSEGAYKRGKKEGPWVLYHPNGNKKTESNFVDGQYAGLYTSYHLNGRRRWQGTYNSGHGNSADGTKEGAWRQYEDDGETLRQETIYHRGSKVKPKG
ncbi:MAG: hypothetical protein LC772_02025 [Chloroflexi bacterium]|nr:hypothetical protein [Chloroflexota bacterium]